MSLFQKAGAAGIPDFYSAFSGGAQDGINATNALEKTYQTAFSNEDQRYHVLRKRAATDAFSNAWTSGDPSQIQKVMGLFPEYAKDIQQLIGMRDDQHRKDVGTLAMLMKALTDSGDLQGAKALLDKSGGTIDAATAGTLHGLLDKAAAGDQDASGHLGKLFQGITLAALKPKEIMDWGTGQQRIALQLQQIANQYELGQGRLALGQGQLGLGYQRLGEMQRYHQQMLERGTPGEREWEFFNNLPPDQQAQYLNMKRGPGAGGGAGMFSGPQSVKLANGQTVEIDPKVHGAGPGAFYQGRDAEGKLINVPVSTVVTPVSSAGQATQNLISGDLNFLLNAAPADLEHITGYARGGGVGKMPLGADTYTGYKGGTARKVFDAAKRIQGNMQNKGIAAAKEMGASGINTVAEAKMYFQSMPQLDHSSPEALIDSVDKIKTYTEQFNQSHAVNYSPAPGKGGKSGASSMSDEELLKGL